MSGLTRYRPEQPNDKYLLTIGNRKYYSDYFPQNDQNPENKTTPDNVKNGYVEPLMLKNETPSAFIVNSDGLTMMYGGLSTLGTHLISKMKVESVDTMMPKLPDRVFMNDQQKDQWLQDFITNT